MFMFIISHIETISLKNNRGTGSDHPISFFSAYRANLVVFIGDALEHIKAMSTFLTFEFVSWHI